MPSPGGRETHAPHAVVVQLEPAFFMTRIGCTAGRDSPVDNWIELTSPVEPGALRVRIGDRRRD